MKEDSSLRDRFINRFGSVTAKSYVAQAEPLQLAGRHMTKTSRFWGSRLRGLYWGAGVENRLLTQPALSDFSILDLGLVLG